jgi:hypothetical protein
MRKLFFDDTRTGTFVSIDELRKFCFGMCFEQRMNMILIMIPSSNVILYFLPLSKNICFALSDTAVLITLRRYLITRAR